MPLVGGTKTGSSRGESPKVAYCLKAWKLESAFLQWKSVLGRGVSRIGGPPVREDGEREPANPGLSNKRFVAGTKLEKIDKDQWEILDVVCY